MFTVSTHPQGYTIRLGDGKHGGYLAYSVDEVGSALRHYFRPSNEKHTSSSGSYNEDCPFCREMKGADMKWKA